MIKQTLTFGGIIIATLAVLTLTNVHLPTAGERFTAQLINSIEEKDGSSKEPEKEGEDKGLPIKEVGEREGCEESPIKEGEKLPEKEGCEESPIKDSGGEEEGDGKELPVKESDEKEGEEELPIKESEVKEVPEKEEEGELPVKESDVKEGEEVFPIKESGIKENPVKEGSVKESGLVKEIPEKEETRLVKLAISRKVESHSLKMSESSPKIAEEKVAEERVLEVKKEEVAIPLLPTQEPKPIIENDYRITPSTSNETKEILEKVEALVCFEDYIKPGASNNNRNEVRRWQEFLNTYMKTNLDVTGTYDLSTQEAVKAFQQRHYDYIIAPWTPPLSPRTTGYIYKTTRSMANYIIGCPEPEVFLEDAGVWYSHLEQEITFQ